MAIIHVNLTLVFSLFTFCSTIDGTGCVTTFLSEHSRKLTEIASFRKIIDGPHQQTPHAK